MPRRLDPDQLPRRGREPAARQPEPMDGTAAQAGHGPIDTGVTDTTVERGSAEPRVFASDDAAVAYGHQVWADLFGPDGMPAEQRDAIMAYTTDSEPINEFLRHGLVVDEVDEPLSPEDISFIEQHIQSLDAALATRPVPEPIMVYRGVGADSFDRPPAELEGTLQVDRAYLSSSIGSAYMGYGQMEVLLELHLPAGTHAMYVGPGSSWQDDEREVLIARETPYEITGVERITTSSGTQQWIVRGVVVPPAP